MPKRLSTRFVRRHNLWQGNLDHKKPSLLEPSPLLWRQTFYNKYFCACGALCKVGHDIFGNLCVSVGIWESVTCRTRAGRLVRVFKIQWVWMFMSHTWWAGPSRARETRTFLVFCLFILFNPWPESQDSCKVVVSDFTSLLPILSIFQKHRTDAPLYF